MLSAEICKTFEELGWGEIWRQKGVEEGELKGKLEGELKGKAELLVRQLSRRFGPLPKWAETRVNKAKSEQLEKWADTVLDASSLTEVIGAPKSSARR